MDGYCKGERQSGSRDGEHIYILGTWYTAAPSPASIPFHLVCLTLSEESKSARARPAAPPLLISYIVVRLADQMDDPTTTETLDELPMRLRERLS